MLLKRNELALIDIMYREMFHKMCIYAKKQLLDNELAEEAVQETFRVACEKIDQVLSSKNPRGWLMQALKYTILNIKREREYLGKLYILLSVEESTENLTDDNINLMYSDLISEDDFEMLKMIVLGNCTLKEAADEFGITLNACKKRMERIKKKLQHLLNSDEEEGRL